MRRWPGGGGQFGRRWFAWRQLAFAAPASADAGLPDAGRRLRRRARRVRAAGGVDQSGNEHHIWTRLRRLQHAHPVPPARPGRQLRPRADGVDRRGGTRPSPPWTSTTMATWSRSGPGRRAAICASRPPRGPRAGSFGSVQTVSAAGQNADRPRVSIDSAGKAVAVWIQYESGRAARTDPGRDAPSQEVASVPPRPSPRPGQDAFDAQVEAGPIADANAAVDLEPLGRLEPARAELPAARRGGFPAPEGSEPAAVLAGTRLQRMRDRRTARTARASSSRPATHRCAARRR